MDNINQKMKLHYLENLLKEYTALSNPWREYSAFYKTGMNRLNF